MKAYFVGTNSCLEGTKAYLVRTFSYFGVVTFYFSGVDRWMSKKRRLDHIIEQGPDWTDTFIHAFEHM